MAAVVKKERTLVVTLLAILAGVAGVLSFLDAARYMGWLAFTVGDGLKFVLPEAQWFAAIMAAIVGVIYFVVASWLWNLNPSGWLFVVIVSIFNIIFLFLAIIGQTTFGDVALQILLNAVVLILALLPSTKAAFVPTISPEAAAAATSSRVAAAKVSAAAVADATTAAASDATRDGAEVVSDTVEGAADAAVEAVEVGTAAVVDTLGVDVEPEDLTAIEGIGPKIKEVLQAAGINSYAELAATSPEQLRQILSGAGIGADPASWPEQASMAAAGDWDDLKSFQEQLNGGKATS